MFELRGHLHPDEFLEYNLRYDGLTWLRNLCIGGDMNDCRIDSLEVCPALHWLAKQGPVAEDISSEQVHIPLSKRFLPICVYEADL